MYSGILFFSGCNSTADQNIDGHSLLHLIAITRNTCIAPKYHISIDVSCEVIVVLGSTFKYDNANAVIDYNIIV